MFLSCAGARSDDYFAPVYNIDVPPTPPPPPPLGYVHIGIPITIRLRPEWHNCPPPPPDALYFKGTILWLDQGYRRGGNLIVAGFESLKRVSLHLFTESKTLDDFVWRTVAYRSIACSQRKVISADACYERGPPLFC